MRKSNLVVWIAVLASVVLMSCATAPQIVNQTYEPFFVDMEKDFNPKYSEAYLEKIMECSDSFFDQDRQKAFILIQKMLKEQIDNKEWSRVDYFFEFHKDWISESKISDKVDEFRKVINDTISRFTVESIDLIGRENVDEYKPTPSTDGSTLFFTASNKDLSTKEDIYVANFNGLTWTNANPLKGCSEVGVSESVQAVSGDLEILYIMGSYDDSFGKTDLYFLERWEQGEYCYGGHYNFPINTQYFESGVSVFGDSVLMFVSDRPGGMGGYVPKADEVFLGNAWGNMDIYVCTKRDGKWSPPFNLGEVINTPYCENTPFISPDGKTLYFSSNGHTGMGGLDIFKSTRLDSTWLNWSEPVNMGKVINTSGDDWGYKTAVMNGEEIGFYSCDKGFGEEIFLVKK